MECVARAQPLNEAYLASPLVLAAFGVFCAALLYERHDFAGAWPTRRTATVIVVLFCAQSAALAGSNAVLMWLMCARAPAWAAAAARAAYGFYVGVAALLGARRRPGVACVTGLWLLAAVGPLTALLVANVVALGYALVRRALYAHCGIVGAALVCVLIGTARP